jgi:GT2 family glycosyltransferase
LTFYNNVYYCISTTYVKNDISGMVFIIIPVFNRLEMTLQCLDAIHQQTFSDYKVIVVDDGSTDGTAGIVKKKYPRAEILQGDGSFFWTRCVNTALLHVKPIMTEKDFVLHINNDTSFDSSYIKNLVDFHERHPNSILGSLSYDPESKMVSHLGIYHSPWTPFMKQNYREEEIELSRLKGVEYLETVNISARGMLIPAYVINKVGFLDEQNFPQYRSDEDYGIRCKKAGFNIYIPTNAIVYNSRLNTGWDHTIHKVTFSQFYRSLFSLTSTNNLHIRWNWSKKNSAIPPVYYALDVAKLVGGFFKSVLYRRILNKRLN